MNLLLSNHSDIKGLGLLGPLVEIDKSATKTNEEIKDSTILKIELDGIMLSEISHRKKKYCMIALLCRIYKTPPNHGRINSDLGLPEAEGGRRGY